MTLPAYVQSRDILAAYCLHLVIFFRVHFHRGHNPPYADNNTVHRPPNGWLWPQWLQRLHCAILGWWYDIWPCPRSYDCQAACLTPVCISGEVFVVQWERVRLLGKKSDGAFTFQAALYKTGTITFSYREVGGNKLWALALVVFFLIAECVSGSFFCIFTRYLFH